MPVSDGQSETRLAPYLLPVGLACLGGEMPLAAAQPDDRPAPLELSADYTADIWAEPVGDSRGGLRYLDNLSLAVDLDAERTLGIDGVNLHAQLLYNNGTEFSGSVVGDVQGISNIETGIRALRLYEAWAEINLNEHASIKVGLYDLNSEFDVTETGGFFINSSHGIGPDFAQSGENGPSIFPSTALAVRAELEIAPTWYARAAILDAVPGNPMRPRRTIIRLRRDEGALLVGELEYRTDRSRIIAGYWRYSHTFETLQGSGNTVSDGAYIMAERRLITEDGNSDQGLSGWVRLGTAEPQVNPISVYAGGGLVYQGPFRGRDADQIGIAIAWAEFGQPYRDSAIADQREVNVEFGYQAVVSRRLTVQPSVQLVLSPGDAPDTDAALALGLRMLLSL